MPTGIARSAKGRTPMRRLLLAASLASLLLTTSVALADGHHHRGGDRHHRDHRRGERIEVVYLEPRYYVEDYRDYELREPPRGHRWVRTEDGRFILVAVATGIIADILLHH